MSEDNKQQIQDAYAALPKVVQDVITDSDVQAKLRELSKVYSLHLDKWTILENEIMMALLGINEPQDLPSNIVSNVGLTKEQATKITEAVISIVFDPIQDELKSEVGKSKSALEAIDAREKIDISKFSKASVDPGTYAPTTKKTHRQIADPYLEPLE
ncbi:MAG: hypothetical protein LRZ97_01945 [Candidatus Pacebacteria bacterium]|nr:hypothetical protein [Candidatus Paceibacterota bacterium]